MAGMFWGRIGRRFTFSFVAVVILVVGGTGWWSFDLIHAQLEKQMNEHLVAIAQLVADRVDGDVVVQMKPRYEVYKRMRVQLVKTRDQVNAERVSVFDHTGICLISTGSEALVGKSYARLAFDKTEVRSLWQGLATASVRFQDANGINFQTGYAPIYSDSNIVGAVGIEIGVGFVDTLRVFGQGAMLLGVFAAAFTVVVGILLGKSVTGPITRLVAAAQAIGRGELSAPVLIPSRDELGYLGQTLEDMRQGILARDEHVHIEGAEIKAVYRMDLDSNPHELSIDRRGGLVSRFFVTASGMPVRHRRGVLVLEQYAGIKRFWTGSAPDASQGDVFVNQMALRGRFLSSNKQLGLRVKKAI